MAAGGAGGGGGDADTYQPLVLSDYSPLRLAFHDHDTAFMASQVGCVSQDWTAMCLSSTRRVVPVLLSPPLIASLHEAYWVTVGAPVPGPYSRPYTHVPAGDRKLHTAPLAGPRVLRADGPGWPAPPQRPGPHARVSCRYSARGGEACKSCIADHTKRECMYLSPRAASTVWTTCRCKA